MSWVIAQSNELQRDFAVEAGIPRAVDLAEGATADPLREAQSTPESLLQFFFFRLITEPGARPSPWARRSGLLPPR